MKKVVMTGATGMTGSIALQRCLEAPEIQSVLSLVRKPSGVQHEKLKEVVLDNFEDYSSVSKDIKEADVVLFCQGVYTGVVDRETFRKITVDYPLALAKTIENTNCNFCLLSGQGADRTEKSRMMFAKDKGAIENLLSKMDFNFYTLRPGYIYPVEKRKEPNFSYRLGRFLYPMLKPLMGKNGSITSIQLATAIVNIGQNGAKQEILENRDILNYA